MSRISKCLKASKPLALKNVINGGEADNFNGSQAEEQGLMGERVSLPSNSSGHTRRSRTQADSKGELMWTWGLNTSHSAARQQARRALMSL